MGRPNHAATTRTGTSRRDFFQRSGSAAAQTLGAAFEVQHGSNRLVPSAMTAASTNPPPPAPSSCAATPSGI